MSEVHKTMTAVRRLMEGNGFTLRIDAGTNYVIPEFGLGGNTFGPGEILIAMNPDSARLPESITAELFPLLAHEMHHVARMRSVGYGTNLLEAMVSEGLADHFSIEVAGIDPPIWATALSAEELEVWSARATEQWYDRGYDHNPWFFGTGQIPRWAGYSIGFEMAQDDLLANPGRKPSQLFSEPASNFIQ